MVVVIVDEVGEEEVSSSEYSSRRWISCPQASLLILSGAVPRRRWRPSMIDDDEEDEDDGNEDEDEEVMDSTMLVGVGTWIHSREKAISVSVDTRQYWADRSAGLIVSKKSITERCN